ncbi:MAG: hypothetical protein Pg6C_13490 [Treponemataceae bacterium]|nr:MAG: hypothetical protein Pg6C_13490 [Treponemataceae bacterium]
MKYQCQVPSSNIFARVFFPAALFFQALFVRAQPVPSIIYYGTISNSSDAGAISMTQSLFFTQLVQLDKYSVIDRQATQYSDAVLASAGSAAVFYVEITETDGVWECTLHALIPSRDKHAVYGKTYDSYYKILTEAKVLLTSVLRDLEDLSAASSIPQRGISAPSLNALAGNWSGDSTINKVVLLRGGKGFVIFKNGASMNIDAAIQGQRIVISQAGKSNALFYPDLPREVALVVAQTAAPIEWIFTMTDADTLTGIKKTVRFLDGDDQKAVPAEIPAVWKRQP